MCDVCNFIYRPLTPTDNLSEEEKKDKLTLLQNLINESPNNFFPLFAQTLAFYGK